MTEKEFMPLMKRLADEYDPEARGADGRPYRRLNAYGPERTKAIFEAFRWMEPQQFSRLLDRVFREESRAPLVPRLSELWAEVEAEDRKGNNKQLRIAYDDKGGGPVLAAQEAGRVLEMLRRRGGNDSNA